MESKNKITSIEKLNLPKNKERSRAFNNSTASFTSAIDDSSLYYSINENTLDNTLEGSFASLDRTLNEEGTSPNILLKQTKTPKSKKTVSSTPNKRSNYRNVPTMDFTFLKDIIDETEKKMNESKSIENKENISLNNTNDGSSTSIKVASENVLLETQKNISILNEITNIDFEYIEMNTVDNLSTKNESIFGDPINIDGLRSSAEEYNISGITAQSFDDNYNPETLEILDQVLQLEQDFFDSNEQANDEKIHEYNIKNVLDKISLKDLWSKTEYFENLAVDSNLSPLMENMTSMPADNILTKEDCVDSGKHDESIANIVDLKTATPEKLCNKLEKDESVSCFTNDKVVTALKPVPRLRSIFSGISSKVVKRRSLNLQPTYGVQCTVIPIPKPRTTVSKRKSNLFLNEKKSPAIEDKSALFAITETGKSQKEVVSKLKVEINNINRRRSVMNKLNPAQNSTTRDNIVNITKRKTTFTVPSSEDEGNPSNLKRKSILKSPKLKKGTTIRQASNPSNSKRKSIIQSPRQLTAATLKQTNNQSNSKRKSILQSPRQLTTATSKQTNNQSNSKRKSILKSPRMAATTSTQINDSSNLKRKSISNSPRYTIPTSSNNPSTSKRRSILKSPRFSTNTTAKHVRWPILNMKANRQSIIRRQSITNQDNSPKSQLSTITETEVLKDQLKVNKLSNRKSLIPTGLLAKPFIPSMLKTNDQTLNGTIRKINSKMPEQCKYCDRAFAFKQTLDIHLKENCTKIPIKDRRKLLELNIPEPATPVRKPSPSNSADSLAKLKMKLKSPHSGIYHQPKKILMCKNCHEMFFTIFEQMEHQKICS